MNLNNHNTILETVFNSLSFVFWKDRQGRYCGCNQNQAKAFGFNSPEGIIGKTVFELLDDYNSAKLIDDNDNKIMLDKNVLVFEETLVSGGGMKTYLSKKQPIFDDNQNVIGLLGTATDITELVKVRDEKYKLQSEKEKLILQSKIDLQEAVIAENIKFNSFVDEIQRITKAYQLSFLKEKINDNFSKDYSSGDVKLTKRETEILYLLSLGKSPKEIASILSKIQNKPVCSATIGALVNKKLYPKFDVYNLNQLIEKAQLMKIIPFMPDSLINNNE